MKLIQFELKKLMSKKRFIFLLAFIILFVSALFLRNHFFQVESKQDREASISSLIKEAERNLGKLQQTGVDDEKANQMLEIINTLNEFQTIKSTEDWQQALNFENEFLTKLQAYKASGGEFSLPNDEITKTLALNAEFLEKNIKPQDSNYSTALPNFLKQTIDLLINYGIILILLIIVGDSLTSEFKHRHIQLLYTQPLKKSTMINSKFWSAFISYIIFLVLSLITASCIPYFFGELGSFSYPVLIEQNENFSFITIQEYLIFNLTSVTAIILFTLALCLFVTSLFKNTFISFVIIIGTLIGGYTFFNRLSISNIEWFNPFQYVLTNETITQLGYNWYEGIAITLALALLCYLLTLLRIRFVRI